MANARELLQSPDDSKYPTPDRQTSIYNPLSTYLLPSGDQKHYQQQYGDMYFLRLSKLKPTLDKLAEEAWTGYEIAGEVAQRKDRVLDVQQGELCWVTGTVYMDMPLKPNILEDISKDHWISAPPPPREKYISQNGDDQILLEDESGRLRLVGVTVQSEMLVTGCIISVLGAENIAGEFEVVDIKIPDLARQPQRWERDDGEAVLKEGGGKRKKSDIGTRPSGGKVAIVSGLEITGDGGDGLTLDLLMEYLIGESTGPDDQQDSAKISRLIIAGSSLANSSLQSTIAKEEVVSKKSQKKYGYDASAYNPAPTAQLDMFLSTILPTMPVTLLPGESDPVNVAVPQQPFHGALLPHSRAYAALPKSEQPGWFHPVTNPWEGDVEGWRFMGNGGQPIDDIFKYVEGDERIDMMECILRWRLAAPTAPDTLWSYPFQEDDPFVLEETPHVYFVGNQPSFETAIISGRLGQQVRLISVPKFKKTGQLVVVDTDTLEAETVTIEVLEDS